jgi:UDPglucose--hexose-1-phosphate uridylyltransferase
MPVEVIENPSGRRVAYPGGSPGNVALAPDRIGEPMENLTTPHRRLNRLTGEWVLVSPQRAARPWQGQVELSSPEQRPAHDPDCYLCPGSARAAGATTPAYDTVYVFDNDFAALLPDGGPAETRFSVAATIGSAVVLSDRGLLVAEPERGVCRVVCFSPRHDLTLSDMTMAQIRPVVDTWAAQYTELAAIDWVRHVQIFENRGAMMGASNPHPHGQIWANQRLPNEPAKELAEQRAYAADHGRCLLCDYLALEVAAGARIVQENENFVALVPFWAVWPFETLLLPRAHRGALPELDNCERDGLADIVRRLTRRYNRLFDTPFPYSMGLHQAPTDGDHPQWHLHVHFYPPLLRSTSIRKFMVGYELLAQPQTSGSGAAPVV